MATNRGLDGKSTQFEGETGVLSDTVKSTKDGFMVNEIGGFGLSWPGQRRNP